MSEQNKTNFDLILRERLALQRTELANQSTFLSFLRTSMYFLMAGLTIHNVFHRKDYSILEIVMFVISSVVLVAGTINYIKHAKIISKRQVHVGNFKEEYLNNKNL